MPRSLAKQRRFVGLALLLSLLTSTGCSFQSTSRGSTTDADQQHHEHDHKHDHGIPNHKPDSFAEAVERLPKRYRWLAAEIRAGHGDHAAEQQQELLDLIRWLPELAADTDLRKPEWEAVQRAANDLEQLVHAAGADSTSDQTVTFQHLVESLRPLAAKTRSDSSVSVADGPDDTDQQDR